MESSFFGYEIEANTTYSHSPPEGTVLKLTNAALGGASEEGKRTTLSIEVQDKKFVIANFIGGRSEHAMLDLALDEGQEVKFTVTGETSVHISGYYSLFDDDEDDFDDEELEGLYGEDDSDDEEVDQELIKQLQDKQSKAGSKLKIEELEEDSSDEEGEVKESGKRPLEESFEESEEEKPVKQQKLETGKQQTKQQPPKQQQKGGQQQKQAPKQGGQQKQQPKQGGQQQKGGQQKGGQQKGGNQPQKKKK